ncbi:MAG: NAD(P)H-dependent glycerol-3-phosphate dehydrogenase [Pseudobutyrivibrio sp.]|nr:NAD(P)H-dependent glycerol-3-phosphate dehydrogenase [Pseudobutyrivibrio sp.]
MARISVLGAGSWGIALAVMLEKNGHEVTVWSHRQSQVDQMKDTHTSDKIKGVKLPDSLIFTADIQSAVLSADVVLFAVPSKATRETAEKIKQFINDNQIFITVTKGIEEDTLFTQTEILEDVLGKDKRICVLSGPSHAEEVVVFNPTVVVAGSTDRQVALFVQNLFMNKYFRVYSSPDVKGIEVGAALKNVIALAAGMSDGLGFGDNAKAALITRGIKEISSLAVAMGGQAETLSGLTGVGDLIVTCSSMHSRNRMAGFYIGQGMTKDEAMDKVAMVVEGVYSAKAAKKLAEKYNIEMPIVEIVNAVLFDNLPVKDAVYELMTRSKKDETSELEWE